MATLTQRMEVVEERSDSLESIRAAFMARTDASMARNAEAIGRLERIIERREREGARERVYPEYPRAFVESLESGQFARYFPEYRELPIVPVFSSLSIPAHLVTYLTRRGIYALAMGDEAMQVLNLDAVRRS